MEIFLNKAADVDNMYYAMLNDVKLGFVDSQGQYRNQLHIEAKSKSEAQLKLDELLKTYIISLDTLWK